MFGMKVRREIKIKFVTLRPKDEKNFITAVKSCKETIPTSLPAKI